MKHHLPHWHRGLHAVHFGFMSGLVVLTFMFALLTTLVSPAWIKQSEAAVSPFPSYSFWNTPVPSYTALHPDSNSLVANITQQVSQYGSGFNISSSAPVYQASPETTPVNVQYWDCGIGSPADVASQWQQVPVPFYAVPGGSNNQMVVQSGSDVWEFGYMRNIAGQWQACTGGKLSTGGQGVFPSPYGLSSSGLATIGGQLTPEEIKSGYIDHIVGLALPMTNGFVSPATQSSANSGGAPALGMRFKLDPTVNIQQLGLSPAGVAIARAAQTYGFVIWNTAGSVSVLGNNPVALTSRSIPNPYATVSGYSTALTGFPWDKLQALPTGGDYSSVIPAINSFTVSQTTVKAESTVTLSWQASNLNRCSINGVSDNLPATGSIVSKPLVTATTFVLRCGGQNGAASSQLSVAVTRNSDNNPQQELRPGVIIDEPYSGYANVMPEIMNGSEAERVYKVVYYQNTTYLYETAKPPFALNTSRMDNGKHTVSAQIYYRDGTSDKKSLGIAVSNTPETLFATVQSGVIKAPPSIPLPYALAGVLIAVVGMAIGTWWGWHKAHLH